MLGWLSEIRLVLEFACSYWCLNGADIVYVVPVQLFGSHVKIVTVLCVCVCVCVCVCRQNPYAHLRPTHLEIRRIKRITKHLFTQIVCTCQK